MPSFEPDPRTLAQAGFVPMPFGAERGAASPEIGDFQPSGAPETVSAAAVGETEALAQIGEALRNTREEGRAAGHTEGFEDGRAAGVKLVVRATDAPLYAEDGRL